MEEEIEHVNRQNVSKSTRSSYERCQHKFEELISREYPNFVVNDKNLSARTDSTNVPRVAFDSSKQERYNAQTWIAISSWDVTMWFDY